MMYGLYRGIVEDTADPEERKRYRVRVVNVHRDEQASDSLPWAEWCLYAGKGFGDLPALQKGDAVFVQFERGDRRKPVIMGGWLSYAGGTNDVPAEQTGEYARTQEVWIRTDRAGNKIVMDPEREEIVIEAGGAIVRVRAMDGTVEVIGETSATVRAPQVKVLDATEVTVEAERVLVQASDEVTALVDGTSVNIQCAAEINIGRYEDPILGPAQVSTTDTINIEADTLVKIASLGSIDVDSAGLVSIDAQGVIGLTTQADLNLDSAARIYLRCDGPVDIDAPEVNLNSNTGAINLTTQTDLTIASQADISVTAGQNLSIDAAAALSVTIGGNADVMVTGSATIDAAGNATVKAAGIARMESAGQLQLVAPVIDISASSSLLMDGGGLVRLDATSILIG